MKVSILITTRNRAAFLKETLEAIRPALVPDGLQAEMLIVDNGSSDDTAAVAESAQLDHISVSYVREHRPGKCHACNRGLSETNGELILFVDDDVRPPPDWIHGMCQAMVDHGPCAVAGGVRLAPHLDRPWMTSMHRSWLAATEWLDRTHPRGMVGANMGFSRDVLRRVPGFDAELGPGALGFGDEQLFASQLIEAGYRIIGRQETCVEHHFEPTRLLRDAWIEAARKRGRSQAYRGHHWEHWGSRSLQPRLLLAYLRLQYWRLRHRGTTSLEGAPAQELKLEFNCALLRAHLGEKLRPRNYSWRGLTKRRQESTELMTVDSIPIAVSK
jgi:glycosyltransferase involved in cell wall biosynthesis